MKRQIIGKVPLVTQLEPLEGGYACLAMILAYHRKLVSLGQIKADCGSIKKVPDLDSISQMASFYGLEAERKTVSFSELCSEDVFPCIVTWDRYRYVVIAGVSSSGKYIVNDPANGVLLLDEDNVASLYAGTVLCLKAEQRDGLCQRAPCRNARGSGLRGHNDVYRINPCRDKPCLLKSLHGLPA